MFHPQLIAIEPGFLDSSSNQSLQTQFSIPVQTQRRGGDETMSQLFAAILLFSSPGCPHEEATCVTPTEYVEVSLSTHMLP